MSIHSGKKYSIAISWSRLPPYAAHLIRAVIDSCDLDIYVISSRPVALEGEVKEIIDRRIFWVKAERSYSWSDIGLTPPDFYFQSGWSRKAFSSLGSEVKSANGRVICLSDNSWKNTPRQWLGALVFRLNFLKRFDAVWVPGESGLNLMNFYGFPQDRIYKGMYGSNPDVFTPGPCLEGRPKKFIFVGQLIERKGINILLDAFKEFRKKFPAWQLHVIGDGPIEVTSSSDQNILYEGFKSPHRVAEAMRDSRFLVLPSLEDHWGLVVHEAACSGCGLIVSDSVGAALDLVTPENGFTFPAKSPESLLDALTKAAKKDSLDLKKAYETSLEMAQNFGTHIWPNSLKTIISDLSTS